MGIFSKKAKVRTGPSFKVLEEDLSKNGKLLYHDFIQHATRDKDMGKVMVNGRWCNYYELKTALEIVKQQMGGEPNE